MIFNTDDEHMENVTDVPGIHMIVQYISSALEDRSYLVNCSWQWQCGLAFVQSCDVFRWCSLIVLVFLCLPTP